MEKCVVKIEKHNQHHQASACIDVIRINTLIISNAFSLVNVLSFFTKPSFFSVTPVPIIVPFTNDSEESSGANFKQL